MRNLIFPVCILMFLMAKFSPGQSYNLSQCLDSAVAHYPITKNLIIENQITDLQNQNYSTAYYPQLFLTGQFSYQSDVTKVPSVVPLPGAQIEPINQDWYKIQLDLYQNLFDGGLSSRQKQVENAELIVNQQQIAVNQYQIKRMVNAFFFQSLALEEQKKVVILMQTDLNEQIKQMDAAVTNGLLLAADRNALIVEKLKLEQQLLGLANQLSASLKSLEILTGLSPLDIHQLEVPVFENSSYTSGLKRPELNLFESSLDHLEAVKGLEGVKRMPQLMAYGSLGYGRPGFDMLDNNFVDYWIVGARLNWNIWDWRETRKNKQIIGLHQMTIAHEQENFLRQLDVEINKYQAEINKYRDQIQLDQQIVQLQAIVIETALSKFNNGSTTATEYLVEKNKEMRARLDLELHKLQLLQVQYEYLAELGQL